MVDLKDHHWRADPACPFAAYFLAARADGSAWLGRMDSLNLPAEGRGWTEMLGDDLFL